MVRPAWIDRGLVDSTEIHAMLAHSSASMDERNKITFDTAYARENVRKNRYIDVLANDQHRASLADGQYVNASVVEGVLWEGCSSSASTRKRWIATQGPLETTLDDFLSLLVHSQKPNEQEPHVILMLTAPVEMGREKCVNYIPQHNSPTTTENYTLSLQHTQPATSGKPWRLHTLSLHNRNTQQHIKDVHHFEYIGWPDRSVPEDPLSLVRLLKEAEDINQTNKNSSDSIEPPMIVHCSAGIGRTGVLIALSDLLPLVYHRECINLDLPKPTPFSEHLSKVEGEKAEGEEKEKEEGEDREEKYLKEDPVAYVVNHIRQFRLGMVQTSIQLQLLYMILSQLLL